MGADAQATSFQMPYRLLRLGAPVMLLCSVLFLPISIIVLGYELVWSYFTGESSPISDIRWAEKRFSEPW